MSRQLQTDLLISTAVNNIGSHHLSIKEIQYDPSFPLPLLLSPIVRTKNHSSASQRLESTYGVINENDKHIPQFAFNFRTTLTNLT